MRSQPSTSTTGSTPGYVRRLHPMSAIGQDEAACARANHGLADCSRCIDQCPLLALQGPPPKLNLNPFACSSCGLCAATCPSLALVIEDFPQPKVPADRPLRIACQPVIERYANATVDMAPPCLATFAVDDYLRLSLMAEGGGIEVLDGGQCDRCRVMGSHSHVVWDALEQASRLLSETNNPKIQRQRLTMDAVLPNGSAGAIRADHQPDPARRGFLVGLTRTVISGASPLLNRPAPSVSWRRHRAGNRGDSTRLWLEKLAARQGQAAPATAFLPSLSASTACDLNGACARACPTQALTHSASPPLARLQFDAWRCTSCGACERLCPNHALELSSPRWGDYPSVALTLNQREALECRRCGALVIEHTVGPLCDSCRKSEQLAGEAFALFTRAGPPAPFSSRLPTSAAADSAVQCITRSQDR